MQEPSNTKVLLHRIGMLQSIGLRGRSSNAAASRRQGGSLWTCRCRENSGALIHQNCNLPTEDDSGRCRHFDVSARQGVLEDRFTFSWPMNEFLQVVGAVDIMEESFIINSEMYLHIKR